MMVMGAMAWLSADTDTPRSTDYSCWWFWFREPALPASTREGDPAPTTPLSASPAEFREARGPWSTLHFYARKRKDVARASTPQDVVKVIKQARDVNGVYYTDEMDSSAEDLQATLGDSSTSDEQEVAAYEEAGFAADNTGWKVVSSRKTKKERAETTAKLMQQQNHPSSGQWAHDDNERSRSNKVRQSWRKTTDRARSIYVEDVDTQPLPFSIAEPHTCEDVDHKQ
ncbi:hypothetical protein MRX96_006443 [Rhipicephalus microplus]